MYIEKDSDILNRSMTIHGTIAALSKSAKISYDNASSIVFEAIKEESSHQIKRAISDGFSELGSDIVMGNGNIADNIYNGLDKLDKKEY